jgi:hypothetical protein
MLIRGIEPMSPVKKTGVLTTILYQRHLTLR